MAMFKVIGAKRWKGSVDGQKIDSAKLFCEVQMDDSRNGDSGDTSAWAGGIATEEIRLPKPEFWLPEFERTPFPFMVEIGTVRMSNGKTSREVVNAVRFVTQDGEIKNPLPIKRAA